MKTSREIVDSREIVKQCNALACEFYRLQGCQSPEGFQFYRAHHPAEARCWAMAVAAYDHIEGTDVDAALDLLDHGGEDD